MCAYYSWSSIIFCSRGNNFGFHRSTYSVFSQPILVFIDFFIQNFPNFFEFFHFSNSQKQRQLCLTYYVSSNFYRMFIHFSQFSFWMYFLLGNILKTLSTQLKNKMNLFHESLQKSPLLMRHYRKALDGLGFLLVCMCSSLFEFQFWIFSDCHYSFSWYGRHGINHVEGKFAEKLEKWKFQDFYAIIYRWITKCSKKK